MMLLFNHSQRPYGETDRRPAIPSVNRTVDSTTPDTDMNIGPQNLSNVGR